MELIKRLKVGTEAYLNEDMTKNDFINDLGISRRVFYKLMKDESYYDKLLPSTIRKLLKGLEILGL